MPLRPPWSLRSLSQGEGVNRRAVVVVAAPTGEVVVVAGESRPYKAKMKACAKTLSALPSAMPSETVHATYVSVSRVVEEAVCGVALWLVSPRLRASLLRHAT